VYLLADNTSLISAQPTIVYSASTFSAAHAVPLPASFWLMSSMLAGFGMWRRQRA